MKKATTRYIVPGNMKKVLFLLAASTLGLPALVQAKLNAAPQNTLGINTIQIANSHIGFGAYYERILSPKGKLSVIVPVSIGWEIYSNSMMTQAANTPYTSFFANPGLKFYPFGNRKFFSYAFGMSVFSQMGRSSQIYGNVGGPPLNGQHETYKFSSAGLSINNYLNFKINKNLSFGFEIGIGPSLYNNFKPQNEEIVVKGGTLIYQNIAFQIAYQF